MMRKSSSDMNTFFSIIITLALHIFGVDYDQSLAVYNGHVVVYELTMYTNEDVFKKLVSVFSF